MLKVLVVDDEMPIRQWLEFCIEKIEDAELAGAAQNGAEGYSMFRKSMADVVITDIRMPVMDGLEMLRMIRNLKPSVYPIVLTSFEDFEYAREAMSLGTAEYILKTEISDESLRKSLRKAAEAIGRIGDESVSRIEAVADRNYLLRSLVLRDEAIPCRERVLEEYGIRLREGPFLAFNVFLEHKGDSFHRPREAFLQNTMRFPVDDENTMIVGNVRGRWESELELRQECRSYCRKILEQAPCRIGVSGLYSRREMLSEAMMEAYRRCFRRFYRPGEPIFAAGNAWYWDFPDKDKYKILFSKNLVGQDIRKAVQVKNQALEAVAETEPLNVEAVREMFEYFMVSVLHTTKEDIEKAEEEVRRLRERLWACPTMESLAELVNRFFEEHGLEGDGGRGYSQAVRRAIAYMEEHYAGALALSDVAAHVGLSAEYLSRLFREDTGMKFIVYLNNLRLKHAIDLLEHTNLKVYEVAEQVGYSNLSYFSTVFKKNIGQNPFEYKNNFPGGRQPE